MVSSRVWSGTGALVSSIGVSACSCGGSPWSEAGSLASEDRWDKGTSPRWIPGERGMWGVRQCSSRRRGAPAEPIVFMRWEEGRGEPDPMREAPAPTRTSGVWEEGTTGTSMGVSSCPPLREAAGRCAVQPGRRRGQRKYL